MTPLRRLFGCYTNKEIASLFDAVIDNDFVPFSILRMAS
jgi:hypothetical protein